MGSKGMKILDDLFASGGLKKSWLASRAGYSSYQTFDYHCQNGLPDDKKEALAKALDDQGKDLIRAAKEIRRS